MIQKNQKESELRQATIMFVDISGFTAMSEKMSPEEVTFVMNSTFTFMEEVILQYGGTIDKFIGDCVMVLFGVPVAIENASLKGVNTAIEIRNKLYEKNRDLAIPLDVHIGINTGMVLAGMVGADKKKEFTVMGDTVNLASRLEGVSGKGQILVSHSTYNETKDFFVYKALKPVYLKGKEKEVPIYELLATSETIIQEKNLRNRKIQSEQVGREEELMRIQQRIHLLFNDEGGIVNIIGEAGIGKSRLMTELKKSESFSKIILLEGRTLSIGRTLSFYPVIDMFKHWADIGEDDYDTVIVDKIETTIRNIDPEKFIEIVPFIATLMGVRLTGAYAERIEGISGEALEKLIFKNTRDLLITASRVKPLVIRMEDLHWADNSSLEFLESLFGLTKNYRILFINIFRPRYPETSEKLLTVIVDQYKNYYTEVELKPLSESNSNELINNLLQIKGLSHTVKSRVLKNSGGNPFFIEEVIRSFIDEGVIIQKNDGFEVTEDINSVEIPHTINELIMSRIDRLPEETRNLVKEASVIGRYFFYNILKEIINNATDLDEKLEYLKEIQFIWERRRFGELEFFFKHILTREAAYESLLLSRRKELHLKVAGIIEKIFNDRLHEFYGMLAFHYSKGEDLEKAEFFMLKAGEEAMKSSASSEALHYFINALELYRNESGDGIDPEKVANIELNIALALFNRGQYAESVKYFDRVMNYYNLSLASNKFFRMIQFISGFLNFLIAVYFPGLKFKKDPPGADKKLLECNQHKIGALAYLDPERMFIESFNPKTLTSNYDLNMIENGFGYFSLMCVLFVYTGVSFNLSRKVLQTAEKIKHKFSGELISFELARLMHNAFYGNWKMCQYRKDLVQESFRVGNLFHTPVYILYSHLVMLETADFGEAKKLVDSMEMISEEFNHDTSKVMKGCIWGYQLLKYRKIEEAYLELESAQTLAEKIDFKIAIIMSLSLKARIQVFKRDFSIADSILKYAKELQININMPNYHKSYFLISKLYLYQAYVKESIQSDKKEEIKKFSRSVMQAGKETVKNSMNDAYSRVEAFRLMGISCWLTNKSKKAFKWWIKAKKEGERLGANIELARTYFEIGKRLLDPNTLNREIDGLNGAYFLEKARELFVELDLQYDLELLEKNYFDIIKKSK